MINEIVTDAVNMELHSSDWNISTDKISPYVSLTDEKSNSVFGIVTIKLDSKKPVKYYPSPYLLVKDKVQSLQVIAKPKTHYKNSLTTTFGRSLTILLSHEDRVRVHIKMNFTGDLRGERRVV